jgi:hypothetical protein
LANYVCCIAHEATKQLSLHALQPILAFQLKRYKRDTVTSSGYVGFAAGGYAGNGSGGPSVAVKLDTTIALPARLDMSPYVSAHAHHKQGGDAVDGAGFDPVLDADPRYLYHLYGVVNHISQPGGYPRTLFVGESALLICYNSKFQENVYGPIHVLHPGGTTLVPV